jgi:hypothetical protein
MPKSSPNRYSQLVERIFFLHYEEGAYEVDFDREEIGRIAAELGIKPPKNLGDVIYSFRFRTALPEAIRATAPEGTDWVIRLVGASRYRVCRNDAFLHRSNESYGRDESPGFNAGSHCDVCPQCICSGLRGKEKRATGSVRILPAQSPRPED